MSIPALNWAFSVPVAGPAKAVLIALANHANEACECWPNQARIALHSGFADRTVRKAIAELESLRLVVNGPSFYTLCIGAEIEKPAPRAARLARTNRDEPPKPARGASETGTSCQPNRHVVPPKPARGAAYIENHQEPSKEPPLNQSVALLFDADVGKVPALVNGKAAAFAEFWSLYPHRLSGGRLIKPDKALAERAFATASKSVPAQAIVDAVRDYPFQRDSPEFIPGPAVWLNKQRYLVEIDHSATSTGDDMEAARRDWKIGGLAELEELHRQKEIEDGH